MPIQGVSQGSLFTDSVFIANYNSLQTSITKRMQHGFQLQGSYMWSKNLDEVNGEGGTDTFELQLADQQPTRSDGNHLRSGGRRSGPASGGRTSPGRRRSLHRCQQLARQLLTDWEFSGIGVIQSGAALSVFDSNAGSVYGNFNEPGRGHREQSIDPWIIILARDRKWRYLDANAFTRAPEAPNGTSLADQDFGNSGVGIVRGPGSTTSTWRSSGYFR